jgi:hypothetical protein
MLQHNVSGVQVVKLIAESFAHICRYFITASS